MTVITMPSSEKKADNVPLVTNIEIDPSAQVSVFFLRSAAPPSCHTCNKHTSPRRSSRSILEYFVKVFFVYENPFSFVSEYFCSFSLSIYTLLRKFFRTLVAATRVIKHGPRQTYGRDVNAHEPTNNYYYCNTFVPQ